MFVKRSGGQKAKKSLKLYMRIVFVKEEGYSSPLSTLWVCMCVRMCMTSVGEGTRELNGRAHVSAGLGVWLLISMCHSALFPGCLPTQINPVHPEWRKPATETNERCESCGILKKMSHQGPMQSLNHLSFPSTFFFRVSGKPKSCLRCTMGFQQRPEELSSVVNTERVKQMEGRRQRGRDEREKNDRGQCQREIGLVFRW